ncbi:MAG: dTDP-glucose 4,6-dehydratase [Myxococcota bacterium]|nr:dTDP-glucose 4,6-dehydratase [Myxococcota bacterium]
MEKSLAPRSVLVTGGCGFIGSCFIRMLRDRDPEMEIVNLDLLTYAGNPENLPGIADSPRYRWVRGDVRHEETVESLVGSADWVVHFAAESHVDRSTAAKAGAFVDTNVYGTFVLLDAVRRLRPECRYLQIGTDEVYGDVAFPQMPDEGSMLDPSSPYSASKAGADHIALAFARTHGLDVMVSRCTNNYGAYQYPEKMIPLFITNALDSLPIPLYDGGGQIRDWLRVEDHCEALLLILEEGRPGEIYNVGANQEPERSNLEITEMILECTGASASLIEHRHGLRPGHDQRYAVATGKIKALGWTPRADIQEGIASTVRWYAENRGWWEAIKSGAYREFYEAHYGRPAS